MTLFTDEIDKAIKTLESFLDNPRVGMTDTIGQTGPPGFGDRIRIDNSITNYSGSGRPWNRRIDRRQTLNFVAVCTTFSGKTA
ncbi:hypothetical protein [Williamsia muralis]|uniref:Uncharacterized protein n=1 Tax=Williamsia marianensis TaxID=85044 RepID=A0ABU4EMR9_WILMA|nr:hypothetical protein [Williamsia muralis]MDV7132544.1 hypothetical protein [Williamsia muralis]